MSSIFAIDLRNTENYTKQANAIRLGILKDNLEGNTVVIKMAELVLLAIDKNDSVQVKRRAQSMLDYLDIRYEGRESITRQALEKLINIK